MGNVRIITVRSFYPDKFRFEGLRGKYIEGYRSKRIWLIVTKSRFDILSEIKGIKVFLELLNGNVGSR